MSDDASLLGSIPAVVPAEAAAPVPAPVAPPAVEVVEKDDREWKEVALDHVQRVARRPETRFAAGGLVVGALLTLALLGSMLQPTGVEEARADSRLAIERLAIVQARLDALEGHAPASEEHAAPSEGAHASADEHAPADDHAAEATSHESDAHAAPVWSYSGDTGPGKWASLAHENGVCVSGREQSPVDLVRAEVGHSVGLEFHYASTAATIVDTDHTIRIDVGEGANYIVLGERRFDLMEINVHGPSEHTVGGRSYPLELQLVHKDKTGKLAIVGVFVEEGGSANFLMSSVIDSLPPTPERPETLAKSIDPGKLLPKEHSSFQYGGSLTTPPCTESVAWAVLVAPITMTEEQVDTLRARLHGANNRPIQPLNDRDLYVDFAAH